MYPNGSRALHVLARHIHSMSLLPRCWIPAFQRLYEYWINIVYTITVVYSLIN
ncbi:hypothetical protein MARSALSMR5_04326 (plasmid) [Marinobacter salarius]|uniref:Uncharacterized protein n=1 Tax=Marinobacter salarius TaxID=1420917 RepID=A0A1W6KG06_9GAMM|nr:hypothetical protein MARSALSMR5_04326 [Marinobacter salarius]